MSVPPQRGVDMIEMFGDERITVNSAGDRGPSNPPAVQEFIVEMRSRGHAESKIRKVVYDNPLNFFAQCPRFSFTPRDAVAEVNATSASPAGAHSTPSRYDHSFLSIPFDTCPVRTYSHAKA